MTLTIIALDRFVVIIFPYRARMQIKTCCLMITLIDLLAMLFTAPYAFNVGTTEGKNKTFLFSELQKYALDEDLLRNNTEMSRMIIVVSER